MQSVSLDTIAEQAEIIETELRAGHTLQLLQGGKRIAEIVPAASQVSEQERIAAWNRFNALIEKGIDLGGLRIENRDELYEREHRLHD
jgi:antitoxin (DNA-binding transcriptional repressor) of toxin-antitoxin stability system